MATKGLKNKKIEQTEVKTILDSVKGMDLTKVVGEVSNLQVSVQNTLAGLSAALTSKIQQVETMDTAIELKEGRLQELYGIENMAITLDEMKAQKEEESKQTEITRQERAKLWLDEEAEYHRKRKREQEQWEYDQVQVRKKWKDEFDAEVLTSKRNEGIRQDLLQKSWTDREIDLKAREQEFTVLAKQVSEFDARLKTEVTRAESALSASLKRDYEHQMALLRKDNESVAATEKIKNAAYELTIKGLEDQVKDLKLQLVSARQDAKEVASQALQSANGRQVAEALQKVMERSEPVSKNK